MKGVNKRKSRLKNHKPSLRRIQKYQALSKAKKEFNKMVDELIIPKVEVAGANSPIGINATQQLTESSQQLQISKVAQGIEARNLDLDKDCFTLEEILKFNFSEVPFLVKGLIPAECISLLVGESDIGKSTLHIQLSLSIVTGTKTFLGKDIDAKHKSVLIVSTEEGIYALGNKIQMQAKKIPIGQDAEKRLIILTTSINIINRIKEILRKTPVDLVIVDAFADVFPGDMNISNRVRIYLNAYSEIIREFKCSVLFVHHVGKSREGLPLHKNQILGSVGIVDKARQALMMSRDKKSTSDRQLTIIKGNYVSDEEKKKALILKFDPESRTYENLVEREINNSNISPTRVIYEEYIEEIRRLRDEGLSYDEIGRKVNKHKSTICRILQKYPAAFDLSNTVSDDDP